jgi:hypothetical protein
MATERTGKEKAARVPLGYFTGVGAGRRGVAWVALGAAVLIAGLAWGSGYWREMASPGPVQAAHAAWEKDCSVCHDPGQPTSSGNGLHRFTGQGKTSDSLCKTCHEGLSHHTSQETGDVGSCATCHKEHRGRASFLSRVPDERCTVCHANLNPETNPAGYAPTITLFERDHPQFRLGEGKERKELGKAPDPGRLRFSHQTHLLAGQGVGWKFDRITDKDLRKRYQDLQKKSLDKEATNSDLVQLDCAACHQLDTTDDRGRPGPARPAGDYILPVTYDQHCKACHPLTFSSELPGVAVPHHLQPAEVNRFLWGVFTEREKPLRVDEAKTPGKDRPLPTREGLRQKVGGQVDEAETDVLFEKDLAKARRFVLEGKATCGLCHYYAGQGATGIPARIVPVNVPEVWFPHARFSHRAHRGVTCASCHHDVEKSTTEKDVLIPGVENCTACHSTARTTAEGKRGGVRQDCITCHRYHYGDHPLAGRGAAARGAAVRRDPRGFLEGHRK